MNTLPTELQQQILTHLPLHSLLTFARTSKRNYNLSTTTLTTLHLAVFSKRVHGILAFLNASPTSFLEDPTLHQIAIPTSPNKDSKDSMTTAKTASITQIERTALIPTNTTTSPPPLNITTPTSALELRQSSIQTQNALLSTLLSTPSLHNLHTLTLHTTAVLLPSFAQTLATSFPSLRHLTLNFSHPYVHDSCLPARYWTSTPDVTMERSPAWNALAGIGEENEGKLRVKGLERLEVRRAGMTGCQVREWIRRNENLREVRLAMVTGVDKCLVEAICAMAEEGGRCLRKLELEDCANLELSDDGDFEWIDGLVDAGLRELSLHGCEGVDGVVLLRVIEERKWEDRGLVHLVLPNEGGGDTQSCTGEFGDDEGGVGHGKRMQKKLEVDPDHM